METSPLWQPPSICAYGAHAVLTSDSHYKHSSYFNIIHYHMKDMFCNLLHVIICRRYFVHFFTYIHLAEWNLSALPPRLPPPHSSSEFSCAGCWTIVGGEHSPLCNGKTTKAQSSCGINAAKCVTISVFCYLFLLQALVQWEGGPTPQSPTKFNTSRFICTVCKPASERGSAEGVADGGGEGEGRKDGAQGQTAGLVMMELISAEQTKVFPTGRESLCVRLSVRVSTNCPSLQPSQHLSASLASKPNALLSHWLLNYSLTEMGTHKCGYSLRLTQRTLHFYETQFLALV